jgi:hypothetical protein
MAEPGFEEYNYVTRVIWVPDTVTTSTAYVSGVVCIVISATDQCVTLDAVLLKFITTER